MRSFALGFVLSLFAAGYALGQATTPSEPASKASPPAATPADFDQQYARMQEQMTKMQQEMEKIRATKDPKERQRLLDEHWATMRQTMTSMHNLFGGGMGRGMMGGPGGGGMGGPMMGGGHMMGPGMMWNDYRSLTPEQLRQRQYMMDRWMPMQQMMMEQMMQHHYRMLQPPAQPPDTGKK